MRAPLVVIVGRPNVGKSTLFNRLIGNRDAIVHDQSGVTRDRNYGDVEWNGKFFRLIDTGGYVPESKDQFEAAIREQVEIAISESDVILFVVDGKDGITVMDEEIARMLRNSNKTFYTIINKVDSEKYENNVHDFYSLGVGEMYDISAMVGRKTGDLLDIITEKFTFTVDDHEGDTRLRIALVGRPNVGKSSLTNALLGIDRSIVTNIPGTTRDSIDSVMKYYGEDILLIDTAGLRRKSKIEETVEFFSTVRTLKAIAECDVAIVMIDAQVGLEHQDLKIIDEAVRRRRGIIIAVNKWDLIEKDANTAKEKEKEIREKISSFDYIPIIFVSALTKQRIFKLVDLCKKIQGDRTRKVPTNVLNDVLLPEIEKTPPPATQTGKEIKIKYITQVGDHYPIFLVFSNFPKYIPDNYRKFMERLIRKHFGFEGVAITVSFKEK